MRPVRSTIVRRLPIGAIVWVWTARARLSSWDPWTTWTQARRAANPTRPAARMR